MISQTIQPVPVIDYNLGLGPDDCSINMSDPWQVLWWSRDLGLTKTQLEAAINHAGTMIADLKGYIDCYQSPGHSLQQAPVLTEKSFVSNQRKLNRSPL